MSRRRPGFIYRRAEDECGIPTDTGEHWDEDVAGEVKGRYDDAEPGHRARILREYIASAEYDAQRRMHMSFAGALAFDAGFTAREVSELLHLRDGQTPAAGWRA